jgi:polar amino acid transport system substrate-binding protein
MGYAMRKIVGKHITSFRNVILLSILLLGGVVFILSPIKAEEFHFPQENNVEKPIIKVLAFYNFKNSYKGQDNKFYGFNIELAKKLLNKAKIDYEIQILPWNRLIRVGQSKRNSLIVSLAKTSEREPLFNWILRIRSVKLDLISRKDPKFENLTKEQIIQGDYLAVCNVGSIQCKMILDFGFAEDKVVRVSGMSDIQKAKMVERSRVDFMIAELDVLNLEIATDGILTDKFSSLMKLNQVSSYLASGHNIDPEVLKRLQEAAKAMQ